MSKAEIGLIGLAVMGENLVMNMESKGFTIAVYNRSTEKVDNFINGRAKGKKIIGCRSVEELVQALEKPRKVMMMIRAGQAVDDMISQLLPLLEPGDVIIDGGNSYFKDTIRRTAEVTEKGLLYVGTGVSGGEEGALNGPCLMPGGNKEAWKLLQPIFTAISAKVDGDIPCCEWIGENGAGKSTTIRLILDMVRRDGGTVTILGRDSRTASVRAKEEIGVVLGSEGIPLCLNAVQAGKVMAGIYRNWDAAAYAELCQKFGLPDKKQYKDYSTGMKMKLCIAVALAHHPKLLLLDEATNGLDPVVRDEVTDLLLNFARDENHSILISSHIVSDLEKLCDTIAFLHKGRLLLCEEKDTLREEYALWHGTAAQLAALDVTVYGKRVTPYGAEALVRRDALPAGAELAPVSIEELFVLMVKEECTE